MSDTPERPEPLAPPSADAPPRRRRGRRLGALLLTILALAAVLAGLALGTQTGLRSALALTQTLAPGLLRVGQAEGRVLGELHLRDLELHLSGLDLRLGALDLDWSPLAAFGGTLRIRSLQASDIDLTLAASDVSAEPPALPDLALPVAIRIDAARIERFRLLRPGTAPPVFALTRADLAASLARGALSLTRLELELPQPRLSARANGEAQLTQTYPLNLELTWDLALEPAATLHGEGRASGDLARLALGQRLSGSVQGQLDLTVQDVLERLRWDGAFRLDGVAVPDFAPDAPPTEIAARLATRGDLQSAHLDGTLNARIPGAPDRGQATARLDVHWQDQVLSIRALDLGESLSAARLQAMGTLDLRQNPPVVELKGDWERVRWPLTGAPTAESPKGRIGVSGTLDDYAYSLTGLVQGPGLPAADLKLAGHGGRARTRIEELLIKTLGGRLQANGEVVWSPALSWVLKVRGQDLNPAALLPGLDDRLALSLDTQGAPADYSYDLTANSQGPGLPPAHLSLRGTGDLKGTEIAAVKLEALNGRVEGHARAGWDPTATWEAELTAAGLDPGVYAPDWPGRIDARIATQGALEPDGPRLSASLDALRGELRSYPVAASGRLRLASGNLRIDGLTASSGPTAARLDGTLGRERLDLAFDLSSPDLASLLPKAKGRFQAKGRLGGTPQAPQLQLELSAKDAELAGQGIASLSGSADLALTPDGPLRIAFDGKRLALGAFVFDTLTLRGDGGMPSHRLSLALAGPQVATRLEANGRLAQGGAYRGTLTRLDLSQDAFGSWRLQQPMPIALDLPKATAGPLCLRNRQGSGGCVGFDRTAAGQWTANVDLDALGVELVQGLLPETLSAEGRARLKGRFQAAGAVLTGRAVAEIPQGRLRLTLGGARNQVLDFSGSRLTLDASERSLAARLALPLKGLGELAGNAELPGWRLDAPASPGQPLRGALRARIEDLARIANLVPDLSGVAGSLDADLTLGGTLAAPTLQGQAGARGLAAEVPLIGLKLTDGSLSLNAAKDRLDLQGRIGVSGSPLALSGDVRLAPGAVAGQATLAGDRLKIADTKDYFVVVSPRVQAALSPAGLRIGGEIQVPEARIRPRALPAGTVSPSPDVVLVDRAGERKAPFPLEIDLRVAMGNDVTLDAFGVRGRLVGDLRVFRMPGKPMLGDGQLAIVDGLYRMSAGFGLAAEIGAPLTIEQGRLVFAKTPLDNPGLLLQAQREGGDAAAGVRVLGTLRNPKLAFFSENDPNMTQADITKYLLTGIPPTRDPGQQNRSLAIGTYIAPKLYMEYESAIGDRQDSVKLRYDLSRRIELQTETGDTPGGDIFYKFDNDWLSGRSMSPTEGK